MRFLSVFCGLAALLAAASPAQAATSSSSLANSASIPASCVISVGSHLNFAYDPLVAHRISKPVATASLSTTCTPGSYQVDIGYGNNTSSAQFTYTDPAYGMGYYTCTRQLSGQNGMVGYDVRNNSGSYANWTSGTQYWSYARSCGGAWTTVFSGTSTGAPSNLTVTARLVDATASTVRAGTYFDSLVVRITF